PQAIDQHRYGLAADAARPAHDLTRGLRDFIVHSLPRLGVLAARTFRRLRITFRQIRGHSDPRRGPAGLGVARFAVRGDRNTAVRFYPTLFYGFLVGQKFN